MGWYFLLEKLLPVVCVFVSNRNMHLGPNFFFTQYLRSILSDEAFIMTAVMVVKWSFDLLFICGRLSGKM